MRQRRSLILFSAEYVLDDTADLKLPSLPESNASVDGGTPVGLTSYNGLFTEDDLRAIEKYISDLDCHPTLRPPTL